MKKNFYKFKINYTLLGGMQPIRRPVYGDIVQIPNPHFSDQSLTGILTDNNQVFVWGGDTIDLGSNYTILNPTDNLNRQTIANNFERIWWEDQNNRQHIEAWNLIRPPVYGDIVEIIIDDALLVGIVYEVDNTNLENSMAFIRSLGGDISSLGDNYTIREPSPDLNRQTIANNFEAWWWDSNTYQVHIIDWNLTRPPNLPPLPEEPNLMLFLPPDNPPAF